MAEMLGINRIFDFFIISQESFTAKFATSLPKYSLSMGLGCRSEPWFSALTAFPEVDACRFQCS